MWWNSILFNSPTISSKLSLLFSYEMTSLRKERELKMTTTMTTTTMTTVKRMNMMKTMMVEISMRMMRKRSKRNLASRSRETKKGNWKSSPRRSHKRKERQPARRRRTARTRRTRRRASRMRTTKEKTSWKTLTLTMTTIEKQVEWRLLAHSFSYHYRHRHPLSIYLCSKRVCDKSQPLRWVVSESENGLWWTPRCWCWSSLLVVVVIWLLWVRLGWSSHRCFKLVNPLSFSLLSLLT